MKAFYGNLESKFGTVAASLSCLHPTQTEKGELAVRELVQQVEQAMAGGNPGLMVASTSGGSSCQAAKEQQGSEGGGQSNRSANHTT